MQYLIKQHKGDPAQEHEGDNNPINGRAGVIPDARIPNGIAGCGDSAEGGAHGVKKSHARKREQKDLKHIQGQVYTPQPDHGVPVSGFKPLFGDDLTGRGFGAKDAKPPHTVGQKDEGQGQKSHTPQQVGFASPEQKAVGKRFNICEDCGAGGGVPGHHFKKSVRKRRDGAVNHEGQCGECGDQHPPENGQRNTVLDAQLIFFSEKPPERQTQSGGNNAGRQNGVEVPFVVIQGTYQG